MAVRRVPDRDLDDSADGWTGDNVFLFRPKESNSWVIEVGAMELLRGEAEGNVREAIAAALRAVPGVEDVHEEDRERWVVSGNPSGEEMTRTVEAALEPFHDAICPQPLDERHIESGPYSLSSAQHANMARESLTATAEEFQRVHLDSRLRQYGWTDAEVEKMAAYFEQLAEKVRAGSDLASVGKINIAKLLSSSGVHGRPKPDDELARAAVRAVRDFNTYVHGTSVQ